MIVPAIELRPDLTTRYARLRGVLGRGYNAVATRTWMRRGRPMWHFPQGANLLLRWTGERLPLPVLGDPSARQAEIVGLASGAETEIDTFEDAIHPPGTVCHFAMVQVTAGGVPNEIDPWQIAVRVFDAAGQPLGLLPNTPAALAVRLLPSRRPVLSWIYSAVYQAAPASTFKVYVSEGDAFDFGSPAGTVTWRRGQTAYSWMGSALAAGDVRWFTVRAATAGGVLGLIPRLGLCPSAEYDTVELGRCPMVRVPEGPPAPVSGTCWPEVLSGPVEVE